MQIITHTFFDKITLLHVMLCYVLLCANLFKIAFTFFIVGFQTFHPNCNNVVGDISAELSSFHHIMRTTLIGQCSALKLVSFKTETRQSEIEEIRNLMG